MPNERKVGLVVIVGVLSGSLVGGVARGAGGRGARVRSAGSGRSSNARASTFVLAPVESHRVGAGLRRASVRRSRARVPADRLQALRVFLPRDLGDLLAGDVLDDQLGSFCSGSVAQPQVAGSRRSRGCSARNSLLPWKPRLRHAATGRRAATSASHASRFDGRDVAVELAQRLRCRARRCRDRASPRPGRCRGPGSPVRAPTRSACRCAARSQLLAAVERRPAAVLGAEEQQVLVSRVLGEAVADLAARQRRTPRSRRRSSPRSSLTNTWVVGSRCCGGRRASGRRGRPRGATARCRRRRAVRTPAGSGRSAASCRRRPSGSRRHSAPSSVPT